MAVHQPTLLGAGDPQVDERAPFERIPLDEHSWVDISRGWLLGADTLLDELATTIEWRQWRRRMYHRMVDDPRLSRWYRAGDPLPNVALAFVKRDLQRHYRVRFGGLGLNYYRDGRDSVAFHSDKELRYLDDTLVAIVTLGTQRPFHLRRTTGGPSVDLSPASGDLLVMGGRCQIDWEHGVPKVAHAGPRISASWRWTSRRGRPTEDGIGYFRRGTRVTTAT